MNRKIFPLLCVIILAVTIGCSQKQSLHGTITFSDDGSPVPTGAIFFTTPTFEAMGAIKKDGTYTVSSTGTNDGIPKGQTYAVTITADEVELTRNADGSVAGEKRTRLIDPKYMNKDTSGLTFTADGKAKKFDIKVDRPQK